MSFSSNKLTPANLSTSPSICPVSIHQHDKTRSKKKIDKRNFRRLQHLYVLPVLLFEFLALALTRAVIPELLLESFGDNVYFIMGCSECVRGLLAFIACPLFGKISDIVGRKVCLFITVLGSCLPVCTLAIMTWGHSKSLFFVHNGYGIGYRAGGGEGTENESKSIEESVYTSSVVSNTSSLVDESLALTHQRMWYFVILLAVSGIFSSTFTLTFAYIADTVREKNDRVSAYGLALATFGLSFTIGPMLGGYLAHVESDDVAEDLESSRGGNLIPLAGQQRVFTTSLVLVLLDLGYILLVLPESNLKSNYATRFHHEDDEGYSDDDSATVRSNSSLSQRWNNFRKDIIPNAWSPLDTLRIFSGDPFMYEVGCIALLYYTSLWAVVSTLMLYAVKRFHLSPERLGELMSALGLSTMISEAVLVRIIVPSIGEKKSMRLGLAAFTLQCVVLGFAYESWQLFICVIFSMLGNLVYPSLTSLVSGAVSEEGIGEALGAINGVKALTEGLGPLFFGTLMTLSEKSVLPGWPYLVAAVLAGTAYKRSRLLPDEDDEEYINELHIGKRRHYNGKEGNAIVTALNAIINSPIKPKKPRSSFDNDGQQDEEYMSLLSEVDEIDENEFLQNYNMQVSSGVQLVPEKEEGN